MKFRERLVLAASLTSLVGLGVGFTSVYAQVNSEHEREVDRVLGVKSREEADEIARAQVGAQLPDDPDLEAEDIGHLHKFAVLYHPGGTVRARSALIGEHAPALESLSGRAAQPFDLRIDGSHVRAVLLPVPGRPGEQLLYGVSRDPLDADAALLARVMTLTFSGVVIWIVAMTWWITNRMTREHAAIAAVARRVAAGDLTARVGRSAPHEDIARLGRDVDSMIEQLSALVKAQRNFVSYAAHELRSPLTAAYGELSNALRKERPAEDYREAIACALEATQHMKVLAEDLLVLARTTDPSGSGMRKPVSLSTTAQVAISQMAHALEARRLRVEVEGDARLPTTNERDLQRLLLNLLDNAAKHSPNGGTVRVRMTESMPAAIELAVEDEGPGVAPEDAERIFEPFFRGERASEEGSGLGLSIVRAIARAHGGEVIVDPRSTERVGARFVVRFALP
ncbi:MAG: HAMP domain-containing sensor histidine kinase [Myxococcales bacterium]